MNKSTFVLMVLALSVLVGRAADQRPSIDHNMGLLRKLLAELALADNGTSVGARFDGLDSEAVSGFNAGMRGRKSSIYDGGHRVPFWTLSRFSRGGDSIPSNNQPLPLATGT